MFLKKRRSLILFLSLLITSLSFAEESHVDFSLSPSHLESGNIQVAFEWLSPHEFRKRNIRVVDLVKVQHLRPHTNHLIASKTAILSKKPMSHFSLSQLYNIHSIATLFRSTSATQLTSDSWRITNKVKAHGLPFKVSFNLSVKEVSPSQLDKDVVHYFRDEGSILKGTGKEYFYTMDMSNFSQLMYRNFSVIYIKEIGPKQTLIVSGIVAGFDLNRANLFFNYPPFSSTKETMVENLRSQIIHMIQMFQ